MNTKTSNYSSPIARMGMIATLLVAAAIPASATTFETGFSLFRMADRADVVADVQLRDYAVGDNGWSGTLTVNAVLLGELEETEIPLRLPPATTELVDGARYLALLQDHPRGWRPVMLDMGMVPWDATLAEALLAARGTAPGSPERLAWLVETLDSASPVARDNAAKALAGRAEQAETLNPAQRTKVMQALERIPNSNGPAKSALIRVMSRWDSPDWTDALIGEMQKPDAIEIRIATTNALQRLGEERALAAIRGAFGEAAPDGRLQLMGLAAGLETATAVNWLERMAGNEQNPHHLQARDLLGRMGTPAARDAIMRLKRK